MEDRLSRLIGAWLACCPKSRDGAQRSRVPGRGVAQRMERPITERRGFALAAAEKRGNVAAACNEVPRFVEHYRMLAKVLVTQQQ